MRGPHSLRLSLVCAPFSTRSVRAKDDVSLSHHPWIGLVMSHHLCLGLALGNFLCRSPAPLQGEMSMMPHSSRPSAPGSAQNGSITESFRLCQGRGPMDSDQTT